MPPACFDPALLALTAILAAALTAGSPTPARGQSDAGGGKPVTISITAQPLAAALNELARQANMQLGFPPALVAGKAAPAVSGKLTARQALDRLLAGSGLVAEVEGAAVVGQPAPPVASTAPVSSLPAVTVTGAAALLAAEVPKSFAGGHVARGSRLGMLGNSDVFDTPFSTKAYTAELILDPPTAATSFAPAVCRPRGVELEVSGEPVQGLRPLGGAARIDAKQSSTEGGATDGRKAIGVLTFTADLGAKLDVPALSGLTLTGRMIHTGSGYVTWPTRNRCPPGTGWTAVCATRRSGRARCCVAIERRQPARHALLHRRRPPVHLGGAAAYVAAVGDGGVLSGLPGSAQVMGRAAGLHPHGLSTGVGRSSK